MLILVRHGQTRINAGGLLQGRIDLPLDEIGRGQAEAIGRAVRARFPDAVVVSSPLQRARQTAESIVPSPVLDERFLELDYGDFDGKAMSDVPDETWALWRRDPHFRPPNGETLVELDARVRPALEELAERARTSDVVIVSHVSPIKSAVTWALGIGPEATWRCSLDRASITTIAVSPRGPALVGFNDTSHLT